ncbi:MAG: hydantoinase/oxoprolinase family protein [Actinomycetota bacterium]|jgi:N-methylhydantoinase A|nr:hydantoinase/oxoprolinase family protein [Actinomycetota bacterium]
MAVLVGSDIGGTFTDVVAYDSELATVVYGKQLTNRADLADSVLSCLDEIEIDPSAISILKHGTTHIINTLLERRGARAALITTEGFRDILEIGRAGRPVAFRLDYDRPAPLVEREMRFEVAERVGADGSIVIPLDVQALEEIAAHLKAAGVDAVAVSFLNSFVNPEHEIAAAEQLRAALPEAYVTSGNELSREWFEYERTSTAVANAYVGPAATHYVDRFEHRLDSAAFPGRFYLMASNGGVLTVEQTKRSPIALVESGPIGGCVGASVFAERLGLERVIAFDMGGTTAKCALVESGRFEVQPTYYVGGYDYGFPLRTPVLDIVEVGTGGGSIAHVVDERLLVGPRSAGSEPGPVCFRGGGVEPTVTDANVALDRISGNQFLRGALPLDRDGARAAVDDRVGGPLGYAASQQTDAVAAGILALANAQMATAIKEITIERGRDVRDFVLFAFGGGGPMHAIDLARELHIPRVVIPPEPGNFSALGMLFADARLDDSLSMRHDLLDDAVARLIEKAEVSTKHLAEQLAQDFPAATLVSEWRAELRFTGQRHSLKVSFSRGDDTDSVRRSFLDKYLRQYGHVDDAAPAEVIGIRVSVAAPTAVPEIGDLHRTEGPGPPSPREVRDVFAVAAGRRMPTPVFSRDELPIGFRAHGPVIVEEFGATTVVGPDESIAVGGLGEIDVFLQGAS